MRLVIQRSIPFPRIRVGKLIDYLATIHREGSVSLSELKNRGLDFGKGRGDLTRFFEKLGLVKVNDGAVSLTEEGKALVSKIDVHGARAIHEYLINELPQYKVVIDVLRDFRALSEEELYAEVNRRISAESPSAWVNKVAIRSMLGIMRDVGVISKINGKYVYVDSPTGTINECLGRLSVKLGDGYIISMGELSKCIGGLVDASRLSLCGSLIAAPNDILLRFKDPLCVRRALGA